jgi:4-hydroxybenzoate polyprenyltransferase
MLRAAGRFLSLIRFSHTLFALPFALLSALMAWRLQGDGAATGERRFAAISLRWQEVAGILLCMVTARSAAMAFNRLVDRRIDAGNPRTSGRHLPAGILSVAQVTAFTSVSAVGFVLSTLLFLPNRLPLYLALPVLAWLLGYSYAKRFTALAHFWLGAALALAPVAAWIAIRGEAVLATPRDLLPALVLGAAVLTWVAGFDVIYACQDCEFDRQTGLRSLPARLGVARALRLAAACHLATILFLALLPAVYPPFGRVFGLGVAGVAALLVYEHVLVRPDDLARVNTAFFHVNAVISLGLLAVGTWDLLVD